MNAKAKVQLAEAVSKSFLKSIERRAKANGVSDDGISSYMIGYLSAFLSDQMATNPKVMTAVAERVYFIQNQE